MANRHQGGLGRGFAEFFQSPATPPQDNPADASSTDLTRDDADNTSATARAVVDVVAQEIRTAKSRAAHTDGTTVPGSAEASSVSAHETAPSVHDERQADSSESEVLERSRLDVVPVNKIHPNPRQPRRSFDEEALLELSESIAEVGLLQPIVVRPDGGNFELVMGERRWRAARLAGLEEIPAIVRGTETKDLLRDALLENLHRAQLNPLEEAAAYQQLLEDFGCTQDELSRRIKRSRPQIANTLRLMKLPRPVQRYLIEGSLTAGHARALLAAHDAEEQVRIAETIVDDGLSVRATEALVKSASDAKTTVKPHVRRKPGSDEQAVRLADRLADIYDTEVRVKRSRGRGSIVLTFDSDEDLERLVGILNRE